MHKLMLRTKKRAALVSLSLLAMGATACGTVDAGGTQKGDPNYPSHAIDWVVPYAPGGGSDTQVRRLQPFVEDALGQSINVVYEEGADGAAGWEQMASASPDGYTIGNVVAPNIMQLAVTGKTSFKPGDFGYVTWTESAQGMVVTGPNSPYKTFDDLVEKARANPGDVTIAGVGQTNALDVKQIEDAIGAKLTYVPISGGSGPIDQQLQGNHVDAALETTSGVLERSNTLKPLAISGADRSEALPDVPSFAELGYEGWTDESSWGVIVPPGTPDSIVKKLNDVVNEAVQTSKLQSSMKKAGLTPMTMSPQEARQYMQEQLAQVKEEVGSAENGSS